MSRKIIGRLFQNSPKPLILFLKKNYKAIFLYVIQAISVWMKSKATQFVSFLARNGQNQENISSNSVYCL